MVWLLRDCSKQSLVGSLAVVIFGQRHQSDLFSTVLRLEHVEPRALPQGSEGLCRFHLLHAARCVVLKNCHGSLSK